MADILTELQEEWGEDFVGNAKETVEYGMAHCAWPHFTYFNDTVPFYGEYEEEIWEMLEEEAEECEMSPLQVIADMRGAEYVGNFTSFANLLTWWAVEEVCNQWLQKQEKDHEVLRR